MLYHRAEDLTSRVVRMKTLSGFMFFSEAVLCRFEISPLIQWVTFPLKLFQLKVLNLYSI